MAQDKGHGDRPYIMPHGPEVGPGWGALAPQIAQAIMARPKLGPIMGTRLTIHPQIQTKWFEERPNGKPTTANWMASQGGPL